MPTYYKATPVNNGKEKIFHVWQFDDSKPKMYIDGHFYKFNSKYIGFLKDDDESHQDFKSIRTGRTMGKNKDLHVFIGMLLLLLVAVYFGA